MNPETIIEKLKEMIGNGNNEMIFFKLKGKLGKGSRLSIKVPLTLAIMPTLMVRLGTQSFAFPLVSVVEIFHLDLTKTNIVDGQECVVVRDNVYPLFYIKRWLVNISYKTVPNE